MAGITSHGKSISPLSSLASYADIVVARQQSSQPWRGMHDEPKEDLSRRLGAHLTTKKVLDNQGTQHLKILLLLSEFVPVNCS